MIYTLDTISSFFSLLNYKYLKKCWKALRCQISLLGTPNQLLSKSIFDAVTMTPDLYLNFSAHVYVIFIKLGSQIETLTFFDIMSLKKCFFLIKTFCNATASVR